MLPVFLLLQTLAHTRPVFHSEADFQLAFAWEVQKMFPEAKVRLELPVMAGGQTMHVDIWVVLDGKPLAIELKYKKRALDTVIDGERFSFKNDAALDPGRYSFIKDIERLERITAHVSMAEGYAVLLTNDRSYWKNSAATPVENAFRLFEGRTLTGELRWGSAAGAGTMKGREQALNLSGSYTLAWGDYSKIAAPPAQFRCLVIHVPAASPQLEQ